MKLANTFIEDLGHTFMEMWHFKQVLLLSALLGGFFSGLLDILIDNQYQFMGVAAAVGVDAFLGITRALINSDFQTKKAFKSIFMLVAYWMLLSCTLIIEAGFPYASWLSESVFIPILSFVIISIIKNLNLLGLLDTEVMNKIFSRIDNHKNSERKKKLAADNDENIFEE